MKFPDLLKPQSTLVHPSIRDVHVPKATALFQKWTGELPEDTFNHKPVLNYCGEMVFAELAILRCFQQEGWDGRWIDNFGKTKYRIGYWGNTSEVIKDLPAKQKALLDRIQKANAECKGGCFDVFCWRDGNVVFAESKWKGNDQIRPNQARWLEAALSIGIPLDSFLIVEWSLVLDSPAARKRRPLSKDLQVSVFRCDRWICRWCNRPVIFAPVMKFLEREVRKSGAAEPLSYFHPRWTRDGAPLLDELGAVLDHVEAFSTGGPDDQKNLATSCSKCNGRKSSAPLDEWSKRPQRNPVKGKYGEPQHWDGLSNLFIALASQAGTKLTASEREWLEALQSRRQSRGVYNFRDDHETEA